MTYADWLKVADLVGKLLPAIIAGLVLLVTVGQNRWNNQVARRAAKVEDQKLRLTLLDRRIALLDQYSEASSEWFEGGEITPALMNSVSKIILEADLIFPEASDRLLAFRRMLQNFRKAEGELERLPDGEDARFTELSDRSVKLAGDLGAEMFEVRKHLVSLARVESVAPLPETVFSLWGGVSRPIPTRKHEVPSQPSGGIS